MSAADSFDAALVGLGAAGSAAASALARRGARVLGLDRFEPPHERGSSHGETRMIREAYFEAPFYVPLVRRAYEAWRELEARSGRTLLRRTGGIMVGPREGELVSGSLASARRHGLPHEELDAEEIRRRFPALRPAEGAVGVLEPRAGFLFPERCIEAFLAEARGAGALLRTGERVTGWRVDGGGVQVWTERGAYRAGRLLLAAGAWTPALVPELPVPLAVERAVQFWFEPLGPSEAAELEPDRCPVYACESEEGRIWYGFPLQPRGVKVGFHHGGEATDPEAVRGQVEDAEAEEMRDVLRRHIPGAAGRLREAGPCLYTNTPDRHFLIDFHPDHPEVLVCSACSGHGFKFASALGEILADLLLEGRSEADLSPFRLDRF